jgi:hypothetical protein
MKALFAVHRFVLLIVAFSLIGGGRLSAEIRWNATFKAQYHSQAQDADIAFDVRTPPNVAGVENYPLVVILNGGLRVPPSDKFPHFQAQPWLLAARVCAAHDDCCVMTASR